MNYESGVVSASDCIGEGWELIKEHYWNFVLLALVAGIVLFGASMVTSLINNIITYGIMLAMGGRPGAPPSMDAAFLIPQGVSYGIGMLLNFFNVTVSGIMFVGVYRAFARVSRENRFEFGDLFSAFNTWKDCLIVAAISTAIQIALVLVVLVIAAGGIAATIGFEVFSGGTLAKRPEVLTPLIPIFLIVFFILFVVGVTIGILQLFVYPLIARGASGSEAFLTSVRAGFANFGGLFLLLFLCGLMMLGGALACGIGMLFVVPIVYAAQFRATELVFGKEAPAFSNEPPSPQQHGFQPGY